MSKRVLTAALAAVVALIGWAAAPGFAADASQGVFEHVVRDAEGSLEEITGALEEAATGAGWELVATVTPGVPKDCSYRAAVLILLDGEYGAELVRANARTGGFAALDRVSVFEDEAGRHVSIVNPGSINRTVLMDDSAHAELTLAHHQKLRQMVESAVTGEPSNQQYGQLRDQGYIGKTMGVVAGGKFEDLVRDLASVPGGDLITVAEQVSAGLARESKKWGMRLAFRADLTDVGVIILGTTGTPMDTKSFEIVNTGGDESRKDYACPGLDHAAAYPIELVIRQDGDEIRISAVDAMFRMKMYFEDAGKWAFMNNVKMPGSIEKELKKQIKNGLE